MVYLILSIILLFLALIIIWSVYLPFYKEKDLELKSDESKIFAPECASIEKKKDNNTKAILFIHGYPTTPAMYSWASNYAFSKGYDVYAPLIPTFGSDYKEFSKTNFTSWFSYIEKIYLNLRKEYKELYIIGVSMGGAMTLKIAEIYNKHEIEPNAIAILAAPVVYNSLFKDRIITSFSAYFARIIKLFVPYIKARSATTFENSNDGGEVWYGYRGSFPGPGLSLIWNLKKIRKNLNKIKTPFISIHDKTDKTVNFKNQKIIKKETCVKNSVFIVTKMGKESKNTHHSLLQYHSIQKELMDEILLFFASNKENIFY